MSHCNINPESIHQYVFRPINSNMYMLIEGDEALIIDPNRSQPAMRTLNTAGVRKILILLTHENYDHTSGVNWLRDNYDCYLICQKNCAVSIADRRNNRPMLTIMAMVAADREIARKTLREIEPYVCYADETFEQEMSLNWRGHNLRLVATPGHTPGSCCIELEKQIVFTGDSWLEGRDVLTRLPGGNRTDFENRTVPYLRGLNPDYWIMPGHGRPFQGSFIEHQQKIGEYAGDEL